MKKRVAVLADETLQRHLLQQALSSLGHEVVLNAQPQRYTTAELEQFNPDVWLLNLAANQDDHCELFDHLFGLPAPVLIGEGRAPEQSSDEFEHWQRSLGRKISKACPASQQSGGDAQQEQQCQAEPVTHEAVGAEMQLERLLLPEIFQPNLDNADNQKPAKQLWLLAASMGGPDAVKEFLDLLPVGLPVGFLYAQHIDATFEQNLPRVVGRHSQWSVRNATANGSVLEGEVVVVPIAQTLEFSASKEIQLVDKSWGGPYSPSIDQLMLSLAACYQDKCGVIVFSGMGEDGSQASEFVSQRGAPIWTQSEETCACPSMPASVRKAGFSSYNSSPRGLAMALINHLLRQHRSSSMEVTQ